MVNKSKNQIEGYPLGKAKDIIIKMFEDDENIRLLLLGSNNINQDLKDKRIFDSLVINLTDDMVKTYITMDTYIVDADTKINCIAIVIQVISHLENIPLLINEKQKFYSEGFYGNRIDVLMDLIMRKLRGNKEFGIGNLELKPRSTMRIIQPTVNHYGKEIIFYMYDFK